MRPILLLSHILCLHIPNCHMRTQMISTHLSQLVSSWDCRHFSCDIAMFTKARGYWGWHLDRTISRDAGWWIRCRFSPPKTNMTMETQRVWKMYLLCKMVFFRCHVSFWGCARNMSMAHKMFWENGVSNKVWFMTHPEHGWKHRKAKYGNHDAVHTSFWQIYNIQIEVSSTVLKRFPILSGI